MATTKNVIIKQYDGKGDYDVINPATSASQTSYSNSSTGLSATTVQGAVDELFTSVSNGKTSIAGAITNKGISTSPTDSFSTMATNINAIPTGPAKSSSDLTVSGATVTAPAGLYASNASKTISSGTITASGSETQSTPSISVSSSGLITASVAATSGTATPSVTTAGYMSSSSGTKTVGTFTMSASSNTKQLSTQAAKTVTPSSSAQTAVSSGVYTTGAITVAAVPTETKTATANGTVTPSSGKFLSSVTVSVPSYTDLS